MPRLILHADQYYLIRRREVDLSCQIEPGWRDTTMAYVEWMKDGVLIDEIDNANIREELLADGPTLRILNGRHHAEGDYQCSAVVRGVRISNGQHIDTRLVSAPVKFRRARITKFDKLDAETVTVYQGQIARLPCSGMPDVIPGPPEIWFEREGVDKPLGLHGDQRYLATVSGMQMPLAKVSDSGNYYCVVRNTFTNQTRKSPHPVYLEVLPKSQTMLEPVLVYPQTLTSPSSPIIFDVVKGQTVLLECIISSAKIVWTKLHSLNSGISLTNDQARFRQIWGNLRIRQVNEADNGVYVCESSPVFSRGDVDGYPKVFYKLQVHSPTDVQLMLGQFDADKSWQLSCLALNLHYEIPMVYMNGLALIDAMDQLGVPPHTNFYTNPINATLTSSVALSGSVQCMSRPAMDEAEVYGNGLERGRAMNLYVDNRLHKQINLISQGPENSTRSIGDTVQLVCLVVPRTTRTLWLKDDKRVPLFGKKRVSLVGTASLQITDIQAEDEGWYTCEAADNTNHKTRSSAYLKVVAEDGVGGNGNGNGNNNSGDKNDSSNNVNDKTKKAYVDLPPDLDHISPIFDADGQELPPQPGAPLSTTTPITSSTPPSPPVAAPSNPPNRLQLSAPRAFVIGRSVRVQWHLPDIHPDARRVTSFSIQLRTQTTSELEASDAAAAAAGVSSSEWITADQQDSHVRAMTIRALIPGKRYFFLYFLVSAQRFTTVSNANFSYQFRVLAILTDRSRVLSEPSEWLRVELDSNNNNNDAVTLPSEAQVKRMLPESDHSLRLIWSHSSMASTDSPDQFIISYGKTEADQQTSFTHIQVNATANEILIENLEPSTEYKAIVTAVNRAGKSQPSQPAYARTKGLLFISLHTASSNDAHSTGLFALVSRSLRNLSSQWNLETVAVGLTAALLAIIALLAFCLICYTIRQRHTKKISKAAKGKFVDTSHRIFNEQRVQKTRFYHDPTMSISMALDDFDEYSPLKASPRAHTFCLQHRLDVDDSHLSDLTAEVGAGAAESFPFGRDTSTLMMPNLYGDGEDYCEQEACDQHPPTHTAFSPNTYSNINSTRTNAFNNTTTAFLTPPLKSTTNNQTIATTAAPQDMIMIKSMTLMSSSNSSTLRRHSGLHNSHADPASIPFNSATSHNSTTNNASSTTSTSLSNHSDFNQLTPDHTPTTVSPTPHFGNTIDEYNHTLTSNCSSNGIIAQTYTNAADSYSAHALNNASNSFILSNVTNAASPLLSRSDINTPITTRPPSQSLITESKLMNMFCTCFSMDDECLRLDGSSRSSQVSSSTNNTNTITTGDTARFLQTFKCTTPNTAALFIGGVTNNNNVGVQMPASTNQAAAIGAAATAGSIYTSSAGPSSSFGCGLTNFSGGGGGGTATTSRTSSFERAYGQNNNNNNHCNNLSRHQQANALLPNNRQIALDQADQTMLMKMMAMNHPQHYLQHEQRLNSDLDLASSSGASSSSNSNTFTHHHRQYNTENDDKTIHLTPAANTTYHYDALENSAHNHLNNANHFTTPYGDANSASSSVPMSFTGYRDQQTNTAAAATTTAAAGMSTPTGDELAYASSTFGYSDGQSQATASSVGSASSDVARSSKSSSCSRTHLTTPTPPPPDDYYSLSNRTANSTPVATLNNRKNYSTSTESQQHTKTLKMPSQ
ncbi:unnamed protein product [Anisakis simplex]|uniref:Uncharacterized protein n=1 Tax=Anisakis simplex TaxID=6269 RepID=A0A3P6QUY0_ANISI|nr:unnamed protein product [Anisakis simplex]